MTRGLIAVAGIIHVEIWGQSPRRQQCDAKHENSVPTTKAFLDLQLDHRGLSPSHPAIGVCQFEIGSC